MSERITNDPRWDSARPSHEYRYKVAGEYTSERDIVLDAACGIGYGKAFLKGTYKPVDKEPLCGNIVVDLNTWEPDFDFDVAVSFETLEHVHHYEHLLSVLKRAKRLICLSTPIVPTTHFNPHHVHDFTYEQVRGMLTDWGKVVHEEIQNGVYGIFVVERGK